jgi:uncharacterized RDD family membrane protein YckC
MAADERSELPWVDEGDYVRASTGKRLANYMIDMAVFYIIIFVLAIFIGLLFPAFLDYIGQKNTASKITEQIIYLFIYAVYMGVVEALLEGKSIGKLFTKTRAINLDGSRITAGKAFERGFGRAVPFCVFSAFGNPCDPWQDRWTDTMVVNDI